MDDDKKKPNDEPEEKPTVAADPNYITLGESEREKKQLEAGDSD